MLFEFRASHFLAVLGLAKKVYDARKDGSRKYQEIRRETKSKHFTIESLSDNAQDQDSLLNRKGIKRKSELLGNIATCKCTMQELEGLIKKHSSLQKDCCGKTKRL